MLSASIQLATGRGGGGGRAQDLWILQLSGDNRPNGDKHY